jgi:hypothetical protein
MAKEIKVAFRQKGEKPEIAERRVNEAFDILFAEVLKRVRKEKLHYLFTNSISAKGGDVIWAS